MQNDEPPGNPFEVDVKQVERELEEPSPHWTDFARPIAQTFLVWLPGVYVATGVFRAVRAGRLAAAFEFNWPQIALTVLVPLLLATFTAVHVVWHTRRWRDKGPSGAAEWRSADVFAGGGLKSRIAF
jgi:hypothetical protein